MQESMISIGSRSMNPRHNLDHGHFDPAANDIHYQSLSHNHVVSMPLSVSAALANKRKRKPAGTPDPDAEVIALSPKALMESDRYVCEICGQGFQREQNLQMHRRRHKVPWKLLKREGATDVRKRVYVCPEPSCLHHSSSHALGDLVGIKKHYRRKHSSLKQWKCHKCSKAYAVQSDYKAHLKTCGTRGHCCDCGRVFSRVESFIEHQDTCSNGEKANTHRSPHQQGSDITDCTATTYSPTITSTRSSAAQHHDRGQESLMMKPAISSPVISGNQNQLSIDLSGQLLPPQREELQLLPGLASAPPFMPNSSIHDFHKHGDDDGDEDDDYNDLNKMAISSTSPSNVASNHQHLHLSIGLNSHHNVSSAGAPKLTKAEEDLSTQCSSSHDLSRGRVFSNHYLQPSSLTGEEWQCEKSIDGHQQRDNRFMDAKLPTKNLHFQRNHTEILSSRSMFSFNNPENHEDNGDVEDNHKRQLVGNPNHHQYHEKMTLVQLVNHEHEQAPLIERLLNAEKALQEAKHQKILVEKELILANTRSIEKQTINHQYCHHEQERPLPINISSLTSTSSSSSSSTSATTPISFSNLNPHQQQIVLLHITCPSCNHIINIDIYPHGD